MPLVLLLGGARSGKSRLAVQCAAAQAAPVVVIATAQARDEDMAERIRRHRAERPEAWHTVEEPADLEGALTVVPRQACVLVDCLTLWVSNLMERGVGDAEIEQRACRAAVLAATRGPVVVAVSNEVGSGIVPSDAVARRFRDLLGRVNTAWAHTARRTALVVAGQVLPLHSAEGIMAELSHQREMWLRS